MARASERRNPVARGASHHDPSARQGDAHRCGGAHALSDASGGTGAHRLHRPDGRGVELMGVRDRGVKDRRPKYRQTLEALSRRTVRVGILGSKAEERHKDEAGEPTPITVAELAVIHEFGTATIPARSFIRVPVDSIRPLIREQLVKYARRSVEGVAAPEKAMEFVG